MVAAVRGRCRWRDGSDRKTLVASNRGFLFGIAPCLALPPPARVHLDHKAVLSAPQVHAVIADRVQAGEATAAVVGGPWGKVTGDSLRLGHGWIVTRAYVADNASAEHWEGVS